MIDLEQAKLFLSMLGSPPHIFQTFTDNKVLRSATPKDPLARVLIGTLEEHSEQLRTLSSKGAGVYIQINGGQSRGKAAVTQVRALFIDADDPARSDETLAVVTKHMPKPSALVSTSPGKYHVYWLINNLPLEKFPVYQKFLASRFSTDASMSNLDRVMRLPGFPHQKEEPLPVVAQFFGTRYSTAELEDSLGNLPEGLIPPAFEIPPPPTFKIPPPPVKKTNPFGIDIPEGYEAPAVLGSGDRTQKMVQHCGYLVQQGHDEAFIRDAIMTMSRELCPPGDIPPSPAALEAEVLGCIAKFIQNREDDIRKVHGEAFVEADTVEQVIPPAPPPPAVEELQKAEPPVRQTLDQWLQQYIFVVDKSRVADSSARGEWAVMALEEFKKQHCGVLVTKSNKMTNAWLHNPNRLTVRGVNYKPAPEPIVTDENGYTFFNEYQGPGIVPAASLDMTRVSTFLEHIEYLLPHKVDRDVFLGWFCMTVTEPLRKLTWTPVMVSAPGAGKGWILEVLKKLMGSSNVKPITPDRIGNQFNSFLFNSTLVCIYDMYKSDNKDTTGKLKGYIDAVESEQNKKGVGERTEKVYANFLIFTNHEESIDIEKGDRRYWIIRLSPPRTKEYYNAIFEWLEDDDNLPHLLRWCQDFKSEAFDPKHPPVNQLKKDLINRGKDEVQVFLEDCIDERRGPFRCDVMCFDTVMTYIEAMTSFGDVKGHTRTVLNRVWSGITTELSTSRVHINLKEGVQGTRKRVRCIRNAIEWNRRTPLLISDEASRAARIAVNPNSGQPELKDVSK